MTIKLCIANTLEDLTQTDFRKFCDQLRECPESPRIRRRAVEDKSNWEIADRLVSTFTETKALQVALDTLRQIHCNQEAETLKQETKALLDKGGRKRKTKPSPAKAKPTSTKAKPSSTKAKPTPTKTKPSSTKAKPTPTKTKPSSTKAKPSSTKAKPSSTKTKPSPTKAKPSSTKTKPSPTKAKPSSTKTKPSPTKAKPSSTKAEPSPTKAEPAPTEKSLSTIKFGKYKGKTFKWLLENDDAYTAYIVASHQKELEGATESKVPQNQWMDNKNALTEYVSAYPEVLEKVRSQRAYMQYREAVESGQVGKVLVGFGAYRSETLEDLYESNDFQKIRYVDYLRTMESTCEPGSKMEFAINYILQRDEERDYDSGPIWKKQKTSYY